MEGFQIVVQAKPRFPTVGEMREAAWSRVTPKDIQDRIVKLKADANVAMHNCDKALQARSTDRSIRIERRSAPIEHSRHAGRILGVR